MNAQLLLDAPAAAAATIPGFDQTRFQADVTRLQAQELPYYAENAACGHCGASSDATDADWLDFQTYVLFKAVLRQVPLSAWCAPFPLAVALHQRAYCLDS